MSDTTTTTTADPPTTTTTAPTATPWHTGIDAELVGHWQNRGYKLDDPKEVAIAAGKQARELEKHFGVSPDQLLKLPKADAKPEEWKALWQKLGAPAEAKDYDFSSIKIAGQDLDPALADSLRGALAAAFVPKDKATSIAASVAKHIEDQGKNTDTATATKYQEEVTKLKASWGNNYDFNLLKAMEGARRLGKEFVAALENSKGSTGYAAIMDGMRRIGSATSEDTFVERGATTGGTPTTREGAVSMLADRQADPAWGKRVTSGEAAAVQEFKNLMQMIAGDQ